MTTSPDPGAKAMSAVLIDDSEDLVFLVRDALERSGLFRVVAEAMDGEQGVAAVRDAQPDVVLLDIAMPVMDGMQALPLIREECPSTIVVMLSAFGDSSGLPERALAMGASGYIRKGGHLRALPEQVRVIVAATRAERAAVARPKLRPAN